MLNPTIKIDLIRRFHVLENLLRFVPFLLGEDMIRLRRGNGKWTLHISQLGLLDETRVCAEARVEFLTVWQEVAHDVFCAVTVSHAANLLAVVHRAHFDKACVDDGVDLWREMGGAFWVVAALRPLHDVEISGAVQRDGVTTEKVRHQDEIAVGGELVGDELCVDKAVADYVGYQEDAVVGGFGFRVGDVGLDCGRGQRDLELGMCLGSHMI